MTRYKREDRGLEAGVMEGMGASGYEKSELEIDPEPGLFLVVETEARWGKVKDEGTGVVGEGNESEELDVFDGELVEDASASPAWKARSDSDSCSSR
jgi:hypothetical protein